MTVPDPFPLQTVVVVPAHNELAHLPQCLRALTTAALCLPTPVVTIVVLDSSDDGSERLAGQFGPDVHFISVDAGNVGAARAAGFEYARSLVRPRSSRTTPGMPPPTRTAWSTPIG